MHLLQKMGWTPGRGLGKEGTGALQPLLLEVKLDTKGLQAKEEIPQRYNNKGVSFVKLPLFTPFSHENYPCHTYMALAGHIKVTPLARMIDELEP